MLMVEWETTMETMVEGLVSMREWFDGVEDVMLWGIATHHVTVSQEMEVQVN